MKINFVGDLSMVGVDPEVFSLDPAIEKYFQSGDINVANLECPLTNSQSVSKYETWHMKAEPKNNKILDMFHVFSLANNHILDFGENGLHDTIHCLDKLGKGRFGAGFNEEEANSPLLIEKDGMKIAFIGITRWYNAKNESFGTATDSVSYVSSIIKDLKKKDYFVIVLPHWNYVHIDYPAPAERKRGKKLIDAGADLIVGAHPHNLQGFEIYKGKYIYHSLGNFIFHTTSQFHKYADQDIRNRKTFILSIDLNQDFSYSVDYKYVYNDNDGVRLMTETEAEETEKVFSKLSDTLSDKGLAKKKFYESSHIIVKKTEKAYKKATELSDSKVKLFLDRLTRVRKQDIMIKLYSMLK